MNLFITAARNCGPPTGSRSVTALAGRETAISNAMTFGAKRVVSGLWRWTARHPEWHPGAFGAEVSSYAARTGDTLILFDPLLPEEPAAREGIVTWIDQQAPLQLILAVTITYHVRSVDELYERQRKRRPVSVIGHPRVAHRLGAAADVFTPLAPGGEGPAGIHALAIGNPTRVETPFWLPRHQALVFGDAIVETGEGLRIWDQEPQTEHRLAWHQEKLLPSLQPLLELPVERILLTHGEPIVNGARAALRDALQAPAWALAHAAAE